MSDELPTPVDSHVAARESCARYGAMLARLQTLPLGITEALANVRQRDRAGLAAALQLAMREAGAAHDETMLLIIGQSLDRMMGDVSGSSAVTTATERLDAATANLGRAVEEIMLQGSGAVPKAKH